MPTDAPIRTAKPKAKPYKLKHERSPFVLVNPNGSRWWRFSYSHSGKKKPPSLSTFPEVALSPARQHRDEASALLAERMDPSTQPKAEKTR